MTLSGGSARCNQHRVRRSPLTSYERCSLSQVALTWGEDPDDDDEVLSTGPEQ